MATTYCCAECFDDHGLRDSIIPSLSSRSGTCNYCKSEEVSLVEPVKLADYFELLTNVYEPDPDGYSLVEWMKKDWKLFTDEQMSLSDAKILLGDILDDGEIVRKPFSPSTSYESEGLVQWDALRDEMMSRNRWFLDENLDTDRLRELLDHLLARKLPETWFRARICGEDENFPIEKMGAPPRRIASHGRANPAGIPYLYLASRPETAVAEVRPHTGARASVGEFTIPRIRAADLRDPRGHVSPFILSGSGEIGQLRADLPLLERLGKELSRPVLPHSAAIDYIPSQYLCEFIKKSGFDGVIYGSSVGEGINLALFDTQKGTCNSVSPYRVSKVSVEVEPSRA